MRAVRLQRPGGELRIESLPLPGPGPGQVLVKIGAAPINPSDLAILRGNTPALRTPWTPGLEGSGTVVKAGKGLIPALRKGKRVACTPDPGGDGTWAEYMVTSAMRCSPLPSEVTLEQGSMMLINPMTALAFIDIARKEQHRALVNNAAASALGKMLLGLSKKYRLPLICIVRKQEHADELVQLGAEYVLNSSSEHFREELHRLAIELDATLFLDAVTGEQTSLLLETAPKGSRLIAYARLSGENMSVDPALLIREDKQLSGFYLANWLRTKNLLSKIRFLSRVGSMLNGTLASKIRLTMPLEQAEEAVSLYTGNMSAGKIILMP